MKFAYRTARAARSPRKQIGRVARTREFDTASRRRRSKGDSQSATNPNDVAIEAANELICASWQREMPHIARCSAEQKPTLIGYELGERRHAFINAADSERAARRDDHNLVAVRPGEIDVCGECERRHKTVNRPPVTIEDDDAASGSWRRLAHPRAKTHFPVLQTTAKYRPLPLHWIMLIASLLCHERSSTS